MTFHFCIIAKEPIFSPFTFFWRRSNRIKNKRTNLYNKSSTSVCLFVRTDVSGTPWHMIIKFCMHNLRISTDFFLKNRKENFEKFFTIFFFNTHFRKKDYEIFFEIFDSFLHSALAGREVGAKRAARRRPRCTSQLFFISWAVKMYLWRIFKILAFRLKYFLHGINAIVYGQM